MTRTTLAPLSHLAPGDESLISSILYMIDIDLMKRLAGALIVGSSLIALLFFLQYVGLLQFP